MNYYGGDRPGDNLFSNSTVALDAQTGKLKWHFQNIRHEIWDYNLPPAPGLIDIRRDGRTIPALAQVGKSGWMFILNRETARLSMVWTNVHSPGQMFPASGIRRHSPFPGSRARSHGSA